MAAQLARSRTLDRRVVSAIMTTAFGATDAEGAWSWRDAYDAIEAMIFVGRSADADVELVEHHRVPEARRESRPDEEVSRGHGTLSKNPAT